MMSKKIFITGISTEVGKTLVSAIVTEALKADYWKPIQAGELDNSDTHKVKGLISNEDSTFFKNSYALNSPMSPHAAAEIDGVTIDVEKILAPDTENTLVIEGAGGLLVPLNTTQTILDIIKPSYKIIVVSRHYLGSINHTLMTVKLLQEKGFEVSLVFSGDENLGTESIIKRMTRAFVIGRVDEEEVINKEVIKKYANKFRKNLMHI